MSIEVTKTPRTGRIWWCADNMAEAVEWKRDFEAKGASVELSPESDRTIVDVIITLEREKAKDVLGVDVSDEEWLIEE